MNSNHYVLISDAGGNFDWDVKGDFSGIISRTVRACEILMRRVGDQTAQLARKSGATVVYADIETRSKDDFHDSLPSEMQRLLSQIRTDLDAFNDLEIETLCLHGYGVGMKALSGHFTFSHTADKDTSIDGSRYFANGNLIDSACEKLKRSRKRRSGLFNWTDWASYALFGWISSVVLSPFVALGITNYSLFQQSKILEFAEEKVIELNQQVKVDSVNLINNKYSVFLHYNPKNEASSDLLNRIKSRLIMDGFKVSGTNDSNISMFGTEKEGPHVSYFVDSNQPREDYEQMLSVVANVVKILNDSRPVNSRSFFAKRHDKSNQTRFIGVWF